MNVQLWQVTQCDKIKQRNEPTYLFWIIVGKLGTFQGNISLKGRKNYYRSQVVRVLLTTVLTIIRKKKLWVMQTTKLQIMSEWMSFTRDNCFIHTSSINWTKAVYCTELPVLEASSQSSVSLLEEETLHVRVVHGTTFLACWLLRWLQSNSNHKAHTTTSHIYHITTSQNFAFLTCRQVCTYTNTQYMYLYSRTCTLTHSISADGSMQDVDPHLTVLCSRQRRHWLPTKKIHRHIVWPTFVVRIELEHSVDDNQVKPMVLFR